MLKSLYIKDYAIIDELNIEFNSGFNVFTGETGAGKSIIVGALTFLIKGKADLSIIKNGKEKSIIEGVFSVEEYMKEKLNDAGIEFDDEIIIRRVISKDGHNSIKINQYTVTLNFLTDLLSSHIDIHSQKDSQFLLNKNNHLLLLDRYSNIEELISKYKKDYEQYVIDLKEYNDLINNTYNESELDYIKFDLKELQDANLDIKEEEKLLEKEKRYKSSEKYITTLQNCISLYEETDTKSNLKNIIKELTFDDPEIVDIKNNIEDSYYSIDDAISALKKILNSFIDDDIDINIIEERLYLYSKLKRKHNCDVNGLIELQSKLANKIKFFEDKDSVLKEKKNKLNIEKDNCLKKAKEIHLIRSNKAKELEKNIIKQTEDLMLNNVKFNVNFSEKEISINGTDDVEFLISLNKGESLKPLKDIASGGEISRLMLALKTIFINYSDCTLAIFDEIDTGVSGKVGLAMGKKIKTISENSQVISITHLASVAACADTHYLIYKNDDSKSTLTHIKQLNQNEIIEELAKISSLDTSDKAIAAAKELYKLARE